MKVRLNHVLVDLEGAELVEEVKTKDVNPQTEKPITKKIKITLGKICANALMNPVKEDSGEKKAQKGGLAMRLYGLDEADLSIEELALVKDLIGQFFGPLVVTQCWELLENK